MRLGLRFDLEPRLDLRACLGLDAQPRFGLRCTPALECELPGIAHYPIPADPAGFARELYAALREADAWGAQVALVVPPPESGLGLAIADRLRKAAAPRL